MQELKDVIAEIERTIGDDTVRSVAMTNAQARTLLAAAKRAVPQTGDGVEAMKQLEPRTPDQRS